MDSPYDHGTLIDGHVVAYNWILFVLLAERDTVVKGQPFPCTYMASDYNTNRVFDFEPLADVRAL